MSALVKMYATRTCPYCIRAEALLVHKGVTNIDKILVDAEPARRDEMEAASGGGRTVPQIFIGETHVGGCDDLIALDAKGGLVPLLS